MYIKIRQNISKPKKFDYKASYTLIAKYTNLGAKCEKQNVYFVPLFSHFAPELHSHKKLKDFVVYFFMALIKYEM